MSMTMVTSARPKKTGTNRRMDLLAGETVGVDAGLGGDSPSSIGVRVGAEVLVAVPRGKGVAEGVETCRGGEVAVELGRGVEIGVAVAVGVGGCVEVGVGSNECNVTSST